MAGNVVDLAGDRVSDTDADDTRTTADMLRDIADRMESGELYHGPGFMLPSGGDDGVQLMNNLGNSVAESVGILEAAKALLLAGEEG